MAAIQIIVSVLMFVVVLIAIQKKFHPVTTLLAVGVVVLFFWGGIMGLFIFTNCMSLIKF